MNKFVPSAVSKIGFAVLVLLQFYALQANAQCLPNWEYIRPITVDNSGNASALTDFQVQFTIATDALISASKMNSDGSDIRFTDVACNNLDYWIESGINTATTVIWVEVNNIPANGSATVNMFYGNAAATTLVSDADATFNLYDGFDSGITDFTNFCGNFTDNSVTGGDLNLAWSSNGLYGSNTTFDFNEAFISEAMVNSTSGSWPGIYWGTETTQEVYGLLVNTTQARVGVQGGGSTWCSGHNWATTPTAYTTSTGLWSFTWIATGDLTAEFPTVGTITSTDNTYNKDEDLHLLIGGISGGTGSINMDWIRARKYTSPEPNQSVGAESFNYNITLSIPKLEYCPQESFDVDYIALGNYLAGNEFIAELSDASGNFGAPIELGRVTSQTSGTISAEIPELIAPGTAYRIRITATSPPFSDDDNGSDITIHPVVTANFDAGLACAGNPTSFTDLSTIVSGTIDGYAYQFGNGSVSNLKDVNYVYPTSGNYDVTLTVTSNQGCVDDTTISIEVFDKPTAGFTFSDNCIGIESAFRNTSSGATSYAWSFGDGGTSTVTDPTYTYAQPGTYSVSLIATNADGCTDTLEQSINIYANPDADFTFLSNCAEDTVEFSNTSSFTGSGALSFAWAFDDGNTSTDENPWNVYAASGSYDVSLIVTSAQSCADTTNKTVSVYPNPTALFVADSVCLGESIAFDNQSSISSGSVSYTWNFGDGNTSTNVQANHTYAAVGTYEVILWAESNRGCMDADTQTVVIYEQPVANFTSNTVCQGDTTNFTNTSTGSNLTYAWDFGDGNTSTDENPQHVYAANGMYNVTLAIENAEGCADTLTKSVIIYAEPMASFGVDSVCQGNNIDFVNNSSIALGTLSYAWNFGDGSAVNTNAQPSHLYGAAGTYTVTLDITSNNGCADSDTQTVVIYEQPEALFTVSNNCFEDTTFFMDQSTGADLSYSWDFGDGNTDTAASPAYVYDTSGTYTVVLNVSNDDGCSDTYQSTLTIHPRPLAGFTVFEDTVCLDQAVQFTNTGTLSGGASNYLWLFGDSTSSTDINPNHLYDTAGIYEVTLIHTSDMGCVDTARNTHVVYPLPDANFSLGNSCYGDTVDFTNLSTIDFGNLNYVWDFSDGITDTATNPQHLFNALGIYDITLDVTSDFGCFDQETKKITVYPVPSANFTFDNECEEDEVSFTNLSTISAGQLSYNWEFSDSFSTQDKNPVRLFDGFGDFGVELTVTSSFGCTDTIWDTVTVYPLPDVSFIADPVCFGETTEFENTTTLADSSAFSSWFWNFGDQDVSFVRNPTHQYTSPGAYDVLLQATSALGCTDSTIQTVIVNELPNNTITPLSPTRFCDGDSVVLSADPLVDIYSWSEGSSTQDITVTEGGTYGLTVESTFGCIDSNSIEITVWELPNVVAYKDTTISKGYSVYLSATGAVFYEWTPAFDLESPTSPETKATPLDSTRFVVSGTDLNGCMNTDSVTVLVLEDFKVEATNVITANGDGVNDFWEIINIETYPNAEVSIYNRYGNELYSSKQYANDWDGKYNGNELPEGTYYYTIQFDGSEQIYKGAVSILR